VWVTLIVPVPVTAPPTVFPDPGFSVPVILVAPVVDILAVVVTVDPDAILTFAQLRLIFVDCNDPPLKLMVRLVKVRIVLAYCVAKAPFMVTSMVPVPVNVVVVTTFETPGFNSPVTFKVVAVRVLVVESVDVEAILMVTHVMAVAVDWAPDPLKLTVKPPNVLVVLVYCEAKAPRIVTSMVPVPVIVPPPTVLDAPGFSVPLTFIVVAEILVEVVTVDPEFIVRMLKTGLELPLMPWVVPLKITVLPVAVIAALSTKSPPIVIVWLPVTKVPALRVRVPDKVAAVVRVMVPADWSVTFANAAPESSLPVF